MNLVLYICPKCRSEFGEPYGGSVDENPEPFLPIECPFCKISFTPQLDDHSAVLLTDQRPS